MVFDIQQMFVFVMLKSVDKQFMIMMMLGVFDGLKLQTV